MATYRLSARAKNDLRKIAAYTLRVWGRQQTITYIADLRSYCSEITLNPALDRGCDYLAPGLLRSERNKHVIFYRRDSTGIRVSRILHQSMLPERHPLD
jgi:toxin ParE1/3/4